MAKRESCFWTDSLSHPGQATASPQART
jgi:hypothetical protein